MPKLLFPKAGVHADDDDDELSPLDRPTQFSLARVATGTRNLIENAEEAQLQAEAKENREVLLPGVDAATAWAFVKGVNEKAGGRRIARSKSLYEQDGSEWRAMWRVKEGFALFFHETWTDLHHLMRYFELIEKNEAPDTSLLEWLVVARVVPAKTARDCVEKFKAAHIPLAKEDCDRLLMAADVAEQITQGEGKA